MDGSARQVIVTGNMTWPNGLTIDQATNRLFWADAKLDKIEVSDLSGGNRQLIMSSTANIHPYGLAVYQNMLYWTDWNTKSISRFNLSSGNQQIIATGLQKPMDIHVFDSSLTFSGTKFTFCFTQMLVWWIAIDLCLHTERVLTNWTENKTKHNLQWHVRRSNKEESLGWDPPKKLFKLFVSVKKVWQTLSNCIAELIQFYFQWNMT